MRTSITSLLLVALAACGDSTGLKGLDPIVLVNNTQSTYPASITWWDQSGQVQFTPLPGTSKSCVKFTATALGDSVRFQIVVGDTTGANGAWTKQWSPWFDPSTGIATGSAIQNYPDGAEYWTLDIAATTDILMKPVKSAPC